MMAWTAIKATIIGKEVACPGSFRLADWRIGIG